MGPEPALRRRGPQALRAVARPPGGDHLPKRKGFRRVYNVLHGFEGDLDEHHQRGRLNGWRFDGLPWEQT